jgi:F0F1-type ATP synthase membrane subunit c/vacuolar-type H+-ATPase subunit K
MENALLYIAGGLMMGLGALGAAVGNVMFAVVS